MKVYRNFMDMYYEHYGEWQQDSSVDKGREVLPYMLKRMDEFRTRALENALKKCGFTCVGGYVGGMMMINMEFKRYYSGYSKAVGTSHVGDEFYSLDRFVHEVFNPFGSELEYVNMLIKDKEIETQEILREKKAEKSALEYYAECLENRPEWADEFSRIWSQNESIEATRKIRRLIQEKKMEMWRNDNGRPSIMPYVPGERD